MERKRIEKLVAFLLIGILMPVSLFPFRINADTITNSNVNINYYLESVTEVSTGSYLQTYKVDFIFDKSYLGWISSKMVGTYINNNTLPTTTSQFTITKAIYVNGSIASTTVSFTTPNTIANGALQSLSQSIQNSNVTPLADLSTLDDILNVLNDINDNIEIDVITELQSIVANTGIANDYLETISKLRQYNFPIESLSFILSTYYYNTDILDLFDNGYYVYPIIHVPSGNRILRRYIYASEMDDDLIMIFGGNVDPSLSVMRSLFNISNGQITNSELISSSNVYKIVKLTLQYTGSSAGNMNINVTSDLDITPIYFNTASYKYITTDFALLYGLSNEFLDNIDIIAQGTNQSNSASGSLDQATSQFSDDANDLVTIEESFNNSMNQSLQSVNPTFNMGSSFLTSANWVSQQFNRIVNNTPFASLITFGLTLGLGLLIIGKVRK